MNFTPKNHKIAPVGILVPSRTWDDCSRGGVTDVAWHPTLSIAPDAISTSVGVGVREQPPT